MKEGEKIKEQLINELKELRQSIGESERPEGYELPETIILLKQEIAERKRAEEELLRARRDWEAIFQAIGHPTLILDPEHNVIIANRAAVSIAGVTGESLLGKKCYEVFHGTDRPPEACPLEKMKGSRQLETVEMEMEALGGVFLVSCTPVFDEKGHLQRVIHIATDITERRRAEEALRESEEKYRSLVANAKDAIFIAQDGRIKFPNPSTLTLTGYSVEEYGTVSFINFIHPEDREMVLDRHTRRLRGEEVPSIYSFRALNNKGEELWVQLNAVRITWEGRPAILCFIRDITPQKRLEAQYLHAQKMEAVGTLAGGIAHDFNNLLQAILGYAEILLADKEKNESGHQELKEIKRAAQRGAELTQQLLTFSRRVESKLRPVNLNLEVKQIQSLLKRTIPKMIEVHLMLTDDLRTIHADPVQIEQILMNLAVNARDAMPEGGKLTIETENVVVDEGYSKMHLGGKPGDYVLLTVSDTGHGMDKETLEHLFEPFFTTKGVGKGTGLGLAMVYGIVKSHDGNILCDSATGKGTTFKIYFPAIEPRTEIEEFKEEKTPDGGKETILVVDDEQPIRDIGEEMLEKYGYRVLTAPDGESALKIYRKEKIHLVILDLIMPGMGGVKCLEELLKINPEAKVVIASGYSVNEPTREVLETGAKSYISKPYAMRQMLKVVRAVLDE